MNAQEKLQQLRKKLEELENLPIPENYQQKKKLEKEKSYKNADIANLETFLLLMVGQRVTDGIKFGAIVEKDLTNGGLPQIWVKWGEAKVPDPEQPSRLTAEPIESAKLPVNFAVKKGLELSIDSELVEVVGFALCTETKRILPKVTGERLISWDLLLPQSEASESSNEVSVVSVEVVQFEELTQDEEKERLRLERIVERSLFEAGRALQEIRDKRLFRSTHKTFELYCRDRFGHSRQKANFMISAAAVYENLTTNGCQKSDDNEISIITVQILPTNERQLRPLAQLTPEQQKKAWQQAVEQSQGKAPSARIVNEVVKKMKEPDEELAIAHHLKLKVGSLVEIHVPNKEKIHQRLARVASVAESTVEVWVRDVEEMELNSYRLKHNQVELVDLTKQPDVAAIIKRIEQLRGLGLDKFEQDLLTLLERCVFLTPVEQSYLEALEKQYIHH